MIKVSIIIPIYNAEKYLEECLNSVINQTFKEIEIICINDCSKDNSINIIKNINDDRIILINNETNIGAGLSRNIALDRAKGEYVFFMDADDYITENFFEELYNTAIHYKSDMVSMLNVYDVYDDKSIKPYDLNYVYNLKKDFKGNSKANISNLYDGTKEGINVATWTKLWNRDFLIKNSIYYSSVLCYQDVEFFYKALIFDPKVSYNHIPKYFYRRHNNSITSKKSIDIKYFESLLLLINNCYNFYLDNNKKEYLKYMFNYSFSFLIYVLNNFEDKENAYKIIKKYIEKLNLNKDNFLNDYDYQLYNNIKYIDNYFNFLILINYIDTKKRLDITEKKLNNLVNTIAWFIPFRKLRDNFKNKLFS
ncbi:glycosyltransferase family 2 protein [uncultured Brachyspira sp.]|uniref:glycosyltransferase family 2 protein n=1 Tax=uncultured Brachyspira sp. TaxID=221953 RepID=UPI00260CB4BF|nr:glycosyltransferase family 2 protein [uncultured Brachyspira sp.]